MLLELRIRDFAVIDDVSIEFGEGFNVLSGETGAGKSIVLGALSLLLGERANSDHVRGGAPRAVVEGVFAIGTHDDIGAFLDERGIPREDDLLILRREVAPEGRNRAWVNGMASTASTVGELGRSLVELHGQHEHQALLDRGRQLELLDLFSGTRERAKTVTELYRERRDAAEELERLEVAHRERGAQEDFLRFQLSEIAAAEVRIGEDEELELESRRLGAAGELTRVLSETAGRLDGEDRSVAPELREAEKRLRRAAEIDPELLSVAEALESAYLAIREAARDLEVRSSSVDLDPARLDAVGRRLELLFKLKRKYGESLDQVLESEATFRRQLDQLESGEDRIRELRERVEGLDARLVEDARALSEVRQAGAVRLVNGVGALLPELGIPDARLEIRFVELETPGPRGVDRVEIVASLNRGMEMRPLRSVASGGELSRIMLALKTVLTRADRTPVIVFDEIDAGVGGGVALRLAELLRSLSAEHQVFVVTHLAQIASAAHHHFVVEKQATADTTRTEVSLVEGSERIGEIARMLGGDAHSTTSRRHADELLAQTRG